jgi:hypothetical protein
MRAGASLKLRWLLIAVSMLLVVPVAADAQSTSPVSEADRELYALVDVTEPEPLNTARLRHIQGLRSQLGLRSDAPFVRRLYSNPARFGAMRSEKMLWGYMLVTPDELPTLGVRSALEWQTQATGPIRELLGASEAGVFLEQNQLVVQCARCDVAGVRAQITQLDLPSPLRESILVRKVRYSSDELADFQRRIADALHAADLDALGTGTNVMANRVDVTIGSRAKPKVQRLLARQFPRDAFGFYVIPAPIDTFDGGHRKFGPPTWFAAARTDGRRGIVVSFTGAAPVTDRSNPCQLDYRATAVERAGGVRITVRPQYRAVHRDPAFCTDEGYGRTAHVELRQPLGSRQLVSGANDDEVPVFDGSTLLRPTWLPPGWKRIGEGGSNSEQFGSVWSRRFGVEAAGDRFSCPSEPRALSVVQGAADPPGTGIPDPYTVVDTVDVRGYPAKRAVDVRSGSTRIEWQEPLGRIALDGASGCANVPGLDLDTLTRIAQGLR